MRINQKHQTNVWFSHRFQCYNQLLTYSALKHRSRKVFVCSQPILKSKATFFVILLRFLENVHVDQSNRSKSPESCSFTHTTPSIKVIMCCLLVNWCLCTFKQVSCSKTRWFYVQNSAITFFIETEKIKNPKKSILIGLKAISREAESIVKNTKYTCLKSSISSFEQKKNRVKRPNIEGSRDTLLFFF